MDHPVGPFECVAVSLRKQTAYTLQRWSGVVATLFILFHVFHLHGWFHSEWWLKRVAEPLGMARFRPYNAASTLGTSPQRLCVPRFLCGCVIACVFTWPMVFGTDGHHWGVCVDALRRQERANWGLRCIWRAVGIIGLSALFAAKTTDPAEARLAEDKIYNSRVESGIMKANPHKRSDEEHAPGVSMTPVESYKKQSARESIVNGNETCCGRWWRLGRPLSDYEVGRVGVAVDLNQPHSSQTVPIAFVRKVVSTAATIKRVS